MGTAEALQIGAFLLIVVLLVKPVGTYLERVFERRKTLLDPLLLRRIHRLIRYLSADKEESPFAPIRLRRRFASPKDERFLALIGKAGSKMILRFTGLRIIVRNGAEYAD